MLDIIIIVMGLIVGYALSSYMYAFCMNLTGGKKLLSSLVVLIAILVVAFFIFLLSLTF